jgi:parvulin-like peptidyl-prolyl isomerase
MFYSIFRRYQQAIMISVTLLTIVGFGSFYTHSDFLDKGGAGRAAAVVYGRDISAAQIQRIGRKSDLCQQFASSDRDIMEMFQLLSVTRQDSRENYIFNNMVLKHEAERLGIEPTDDEILSAIQSMPAFQNEHGVYDSSTYAFMSQVYLFPRGFTGDDLSDLVADSLRVKRIKALLGATTAPSEAEIHSEVTRACQKTQASLVRFKLSDFLATAQAPEEDVKKLYEEKKSTLNTDETRKVKFVAFVLPKSDKPLVGKDRAAALTELGKKAEDFAIAMTDKSAKLEDVAAKTGVKVEESPDFSINTPVGAFGGSRQVAAAAFKLTEKEPNSDVIEGGQGGQGYYVLQLEKINPTRPLTFEEAKASLTDTLKHERAQEALNLKAADVRNKIAADLKAGKAFGESATAQGVKPEDFPAFSLKNPGTDTPDAREIMQVASDLATGELSTPMPTADGTVLVYVSKRLPVDEKEAKETKPEIVDNLVRRQQFALFQEWLKLRRAAAQVKVNYGNS